MRENKSLLFNLHLIDNTDKLLRKTDKTRFTRNGESFMSTRQNQLLHLVAPKSGVCASTDHSILFQLCQIEDISISLITIEWLLRLQTEDQANFGYSTIRPRPSELSITTKLSIREMVKLTSTMSIQCHTNSGDSRTDTSPLKMVRSLMQPKKIRKVNTLPHLTTKDIETNNGKLSMKMRPKKRLQAEMKREIC